MLRGGSRWRWHPGARRCSDRLLQLLPEGSRRRWHPSAGRRCDRLLELLRVGSRWRGSHDVACYGVSWLLEVVICHLGGCGGTLGVLTGSCGSGRFYFGSRNTCCPVLVTSCGPSPFNWSGDVTALRDDVTQGGLVVAGTVRAACCREDFETFGLVVCSMEGDAFIPQCFLQRCYCPVGNV